MSDLASATLALDGGHGEHLRVVQVAGREALSELYRFEVVALAPVEDGAIDEEALGAAAALTLHLGDETRVIHGIVASVDTDGLRSQGAAQYVQHRFELVPRAWRMTRRRRSRIFQHKRLDEILAVVLAEAGVAASWHSSRRYPRLEYCTQYEETDFAFVSRLLAEHGVFFYFEQLGAPDNALAGLAGAGQQLATGGLEAAASALRGLATRMGGSEVMVMCDHATWYPELGAQPPPGLGAIGAGLALASEQLEGLGEVVDVAQGIAGAIASQLGVSRKLRFRPGRGALQHDDSFVVTQYDVRAELTPDESEYRDYDPSRPNAPLRATKGRRDIEDLTADLLAARSPEEAARMVGERAREEGKERALEALGRVGGVAEEIAEGLEGYKLEHYEHHGRFLFPRHEDAEAEATRILRSARRSAIVGRGTSICPLLTPGRRFTLDEHPLDAHNRELVVTEVRHRVDLGGPGEESVSSPTYINELVCVPSRVTYVPERPRRRVVQACVTATVVGPEDEEIYAEQMARVKVQFHWDREGERDEDSSCWIRAMQSWAGARWGTQFVPRIGSEVVVGFDGGDPDRPIILGSLYNAINPSPFPLPEDRTKSGVRTFSTPRGTGGHELSFEDTSGRERVYLHSQRDLSVHAAHDRDVRVEHDDKTEVGGDHTLSVHGSSRTHVAKTHSVAAETGSTRIERDRSAEVRGHDAVRAGSYALSSEGDAVFRSQGNEVHLVGTRESPRSFQVQVEGDTCMTSKKTLSLSAEEEVIIRCGSSMLRLTPDKLEVFSPSILVQGEGARARLAEGNVRLQGDGELTAVFDKALIKSSSASVALTSEAAMDGSRVLLNSPGQAEDSMEHETPEPTIIELRDDDGNPMAYQRYRIRLEDGSEVSGMLDRDGRAELSLPSGGQIDFPDVGDAEPA